MAFRIRVVIVPIVIATNTVAELRTSRRRTARPGDVAASRTAPGLGRRHPAARGAGSGAPSGTMEQPLSHISRGYMGFGVPSPTPEALRSV